MLNASVRTARPIPILSLLHPGGMVHNLWTHRDLTRQFAVRYFLSRYRGTHLGVIWSLIFPLLMLVVFTFIFTQVFSARGVEPPESRPLYAVWLFCGMSIFGIFSASTTRACGLVLENPQYVTKVVFPLEVLIVSNLWASLFYAAIELVFVLIGTAIFAQAFHWTIVFLPLVVLPLILLSLGLSWFFASLTVFARDTANIVTLVIGQLLFFLTPVFWKPEQLLVSMPQLKWMIDWNPLSGIIENARRCTLSGQHPDWESWAFSLFVGAACAQLGYAFFMKSKKGFADVL